MQAHELLMYSVSRFTIAGEELVEYLTKRLNIASI